jgi:DHHC palmitoyltransferase
VCAIAASHFQRVKANGGGGGQKHRLSSPNTIVFWAIVRVFFQVSQLAAAVELASMSEDVPRRRNGLYPPYAPAQIVAGIAMLASIVQFAAVVAPLLQPHAIAPVTLLFCWTVGMVLHAALTTMLVDPIDLRLCRHLQQHERQGAAAHINGGSHSAPPLTTSTTALYYRNPMYRPPLDSTGKRPTLLDRLYHRANAYRQSLPLPMANEVTNTVNNQSSSQPPSPTHSTKHCWICDVTVATQSMHCKFCNKCVANFDHHCMCTYVGTCVPVRARDTRALLGTNPLTLSFIVYCVAYACVSGGGGCNVAPPF